MRNVKFLFTLIAIHGLFLIPIIVGQTVIEPTNKKVASKQIMPRVNLTVGRYIDQNTGTTADEAVRIALDNNGEIRALRDELEATRAMIRQAELRPNPRLKINGSHEFFVGDRYSAGASASLPLELGGRRRARIDVAEKQFAVRKAMLADSERRLAVDVRVQFGASLARIEKLRFIEELLASVDQGFRIISAKVTEGSNAPLERNMSLVELNRIRSMRETTTGKVEIDLLKLRNIMGLEASRPLRIKGEFTNLFTGPPSLVDALKVSIKSRPDIESLRLTLELAKAHLEQARADSRVDAGVSIGFQRLTRVAPKITNQAPLVLGPQLIGENFLTFGVDLMIPVRNRNQGVIESVSYKIGAAQKRIDFGELTIRREVTAAYARYRRAVRALTIYRAGVREQAKENLLVVWQTYEFGKKDLLDYIAEERRFLGLENELVDAELEVYVARIEIYRAINSANLIVR